MGEGAAERWKPIVGFEGFYEVSNLGRVRSLPRNGTARNGNVLKPARDRHGYRRVLLVVNGGKRWNKKVAILVAQAFIPNPQNKPTVDHRDFDRGNDCRRNLRWATRSEQSRFIVEAGRAGAHIGAKGSKHHMRKIYSRDIADICALYQQGLSQVAIAKKYELSQSMIGNILRGKNWRHVVRPVSVRLRKGAGLGNTNARRKTTNEYQPETSTSLTTRIQP